MNVSEPALSFPIRFARDGEEEKLHRVSAGVTDLDYPKFVQKVAALRQPDADRLPDPGVYRPWLKTHAWQELWPKYLHYLTESIWDGDGEKEDQCDGVYRQAGYMSDSIWLSEIDRWIKERPEADGWQIFTASRRWLIDPPEDVGVPITFVPALNEFRSLLVPETVSGDPAIELVFAPIGEEGQGCPRTLDSITGFEDAAPVLEFNFEQEYNSFDVYIKAEMFVTLRHEYITCPLGSKPLL